MESSNVANRPRVTVFGDDRSRSNNTLEGNSFHKNQCHTQSGSTGHVFYAIQRTVLGNFLDFVVETSRLRSHRYIVVVVFGRNQSSIALVGRFLKGHQFCRRLALFQLVQAGSIGFSKAYHNGNRIQKPEGCHDESGPCHSVKGLLAQKGQVKLKFRHRIQQNGKSRPAGRSQRRRQGKGRRRNRSQRKGSRIGHISSVDDPGGTKSRNGSSHQTHGHGLVRVGRPVQRVSNHHQSTSKQNGLLVRLIGPHAVSDRAGQCKPRSHAHHDATQSIGRSQSVGIVGRGRLDNVIVHHEQEARNEIQKERPDIGGIHFSHFAGRCALIVIASIGSAQWPFPPHGQSLHFLFESSNLGVQKLGFQGNSQLRGSHHVKGTYRQQQTLRLVGRLAGLLLPRGLFQQGFQLVGTCPKIRGWFLRADAGKLGGVRHHPVTRHGHHAILQGLQQGHETRNHRLDAKLHAFFSVLFDFRYH
mmetsp:Transcript_15916/g.39951  ORF Transcript_15916/g.39951 Transcript_15916/m.39951 type:complete len:471 (-) Transcript_15916:826-2238(-)